jgi:NAD(P)-dependent dehydrogenase (short-subunit alcohol dehydrogenase family)
VGERLQGKGHWSPGRHKASARRSWNASSPRAQSWVCSTSSPRAQAAADEVRAAFPGAQVLPFAGNVAECATIADGTPEMLHRMTATGFDSVVWGIQCAAPVMARGGGGSIVNIASAAAFLGMPNALIYAGVKAGVLGLTRAAAVELGPQRVRVNAICPGSIQTEGVRINVDPAMAAKRLARTPLVRLGEVQEVVSAALLYLAGDEGNWMTGELMLVDGGATHAVF